jgi:c-di-GMP-binding flagellar brake protein YcgR
MQEAHSRQRDFPRVRNLLLAEISRFDEQGVRADLATGRTLDISYGGLRLELAAPLPVPSNVVLTLAIGDRLVRIRGKTVYLQRMEDDRCAMGVQFTDVAPRARRLLDEHVDRVMVTSAAQQVM